MLTMGFRSLFNESHRHSKQDGDTPVLDIETLINQDLGHSIGTSTAVAEITQDVVPDDVPEAADEQDLSKTTQHILKYPVAKSTIESVQSINYPRLISPYMVELRKSAPVKPVFEYVDNFNDDLLTQVDKCVPQLQTVESQEIIKTVSAPFVAARDETSRLTHATEDAINKRIVVPARKAVADFRQRYSGSLEDANGRAVIRGQIDPVFKPINDRLEKFVEEHLADGDSVPKEGFSNELSRTSRVIINGIQRARPVIKSAPYTTREHVANTYMEFKAKDGDSFFGSISATMHTANKLASETFKSVLNLMGVRDGTNNNAIET